MKVLIFGGTTEGRLLSESLSEAGMDVTLSVTTEFGRIAADHDKVKIITDRLDEDSMAKLIIDGAFESVIDATHPYAVLATSNIKSACDSASAKHYRLKRQKSTDIPGVTYVPNAGTAASLLRETGERILLTIGSKDLEPFTRLNNYAERCFVRILPMSDSLNKALKLGFLGTNIICMHGPFDLEMNVATLKMTGATTLVTKDSGDIGGYEEKVSAARSLGYRVIVITRPDTEEGHTLSGLFELFGIQEPPHYGGRSSFFPLFVDMKGRKVLIIGGGNVAERRLRTLVEFGAEITVISPECSDNIRLAALCGIVNLSERRYESGDIVNLRPLFVIAATNDRQTNQRIMLEATDLGIPVSVADNREECTCYFPAIAENDKYIAGLVSKDGDHKGVRQMAERIRTVVNS